MVRVISIENARTIVIERAGTRELVRLAGIDVSDESRASDLLRRTIGNAWVLVEPAGGEFFVYRSPDALFINRELVLRGFARATMTGIVAQAEVPMTVLGVVDPAGAQSRVSDAPPQTSSDRYRRSPDRPKRPRRPPRRQSRRNP